MLRRAWASLRGALASVGGKEFVGADVLGNKYYTIQDEANKWKRAVEYKKGTWDPSDIPQIWKLWLHYQRETPPTKQEELDIAEYQRIMKDNVKKLEQVDAEQRKKEMEKGLHKENKPYTPDQFFVTWKRKVQQDDGSIDVNTNKKSE